MKTVEVRTFEDIRAVFGCHPNSSILPFLFRGISSEHRLVPTLCYDNVGIPAEHLKELHEVALRKFEEYLAKDHPELSNLNPHQRYIMSRHAGIISSCMDFTKDMSIALQFGMESAGHKPAHIYCYDAEHLPRVEHSDFEKMDTSQRAILKPYLLYRGEGLKLPERTQSIQSGKLLYQPYETISTPLDETESEKMVLLILPPDSFGNIHAHYLENEGLLLTKNLLIDDKDPIMQQKNIINPEAIAEIKAKYNL